MNEKSYSLVYNNINFVVAIDMKTPISIELKKFFYSTDRKTWTPHYMCNFSFERKLKKKIIKKKIIKKK